MKKKHGLLIFLVASAFAAKTQVVLTENFNAPFVPGSSNSWTVQNVSSPVGTINWFQGNAANTFPSYNGGPDDYYAANFNSTNGSTGSGGTISNWLISPVVSLVNGARIEFATRTMASPTVYPDRMQVLICPTATYNIGGATTTSPFSLIFDVNSTLSTATTAVQNGSVVTGYPQGWTVYTATVAGITGTVSGRFAFRYFVTSAGPVGVNSNYIGLDAVKYSLPCALPAMSVAATSTGICSGASIGLSVTSTGTASANTFTWNTGATTSSVNVSPSSSMVYTVSGETSAGCIGTQTVAITVTVTPNIMVPSYTVCTSPATSATLNATGAVTYTWDNSATTSSIAVSPTVTTVYTVTGAAANGACPSSQTATVTLGAGLSVDIMASSTSICAGNVVTLTAISAATSYSWNTGSSVPSITVNPTSNTSYTVGVLSGVIPSVCVGLNSINIIVNDNPTLTVTKSATICSGATFTSLASGAGSYVFSLGQITTTNNPASFVAPFATSASTAQYMVTGTSTNGCSSSGVYSINIIPAPAISASSTKVVDCINTNMTFSASGANSYTWSNGGGNGTTASYSAGAVSTVLVFTVSGTASSGCSSSYEINAFVSTCAGIENQNTYGSLIRTFPNPFSSELSISGLEGRVDIYNLLGQKVLSSEVSETATITTSDLVNGIYILKAYDVNGKELKTVKMVKH